MDNNGQDDKNINNEQTESLSDTKTNDNQGQKDKTNDNNDSLTPDAVTSPSNANIAGEQNAAQVKSTSDEVLGEEVAARDPVRIDKKETNNKQEQSSLGTNTGDTQNKEDSVNANKEAPSKQEDEQSAKVNIVEKENDVQAGNTPNEIKEKVIANNASTEPENQNVDKELEKLLSRIDKGEPPQKLEDAQIKNIIGSIKARMSATDNIGDLQGLAGALAVLASSTNNPELLEQIRNTQEAINQKEAAIELKISSANLDVIMQNPDATREQIERAEQAVNIAKYKAIKDDFHKKLDEDLALLDAAIDSNRASPEQRRILEDDLTDAEREELKRKALLKKEGYEHVYNIKENAEKEIEQNNTKITGIDERLKATKDDNQRQSLEAEKQQYIKANETRQKELDDHVKDELAKRDTERAKLTEFTKLKERVEKYPKFSKDKVREHFELHASEYEKNPDRTALNELHEMVRKVDLAEELGVASASQEINQKQSVQKIDEKQEAVKQDLNKVINQVHDKYSSGHIPREETDKIVNNMSHNLGFDEHAKSIAAKKQVKEITNVKTNTISPPPKTPAVDKNGPGGGTLGGGTGGRGL